VRRKTLLIVWRKGMPNPMSGDDKNRSTNAASQVNDLLARVLETSSAYPARLALVYEDRETSYGALQVNSARVANGFYSAGLAQGDRVVILAKNSDHYVELMLGALRAGIIAVPVNWRLAGPELRLVLEDADPMMIFHDTEFAAVLGRGVGGSSRTQCVSMSEQEGYVQWRDEQSDEVCGPEIDAEDCMLIHYTSGTTGLPKGVMISKRSLAQHRAMEDELGDWYQWTNDESFLLAAPLFHVAGSALLQGTLYRGATCVIQASFDVGEILSILVERRITRLFAPPVVINWLIREIKVQGVVLSHLRLLVYGASPISPVVLREAMKILPNVGFMHNYGMTETGGTQVCMSPAEHDPLKTQQLESCGRACPGVELRIVDPESGVAVAIGAVGEVEIKSAMMMSGYWRKPQATSEVLCDGWYRTGDGGRLDTEGFLYIVDRIKDMIVTGGENVYPVEVENALYQHEAVSVAAVFAVHDPDFGEAVTAAVQLKESFTATGDELRLFLRNKVAGYKIPRAIYIVDELPLTPSGKVKKHELRSLYN
ncbi:MAG: long-chain-fatty-acid--CoA ligase, partial [Pseudomonadales bacterium]